MTPSPFRSASCQRGILALAALVFPAGPQPVRRGRPVAPRPSASGPEAPLLVLSPKAVAISGYGLTKATVVDGGELFGRSR